MGIAHTMQDRAAGTMQFALAKSGMMKVCEGQWTVSAVEGEASSQPLAAQGTPYSML